MGLRMWEVAVEGRALSQQVQAVQGEMLLAVEGVLAERCSLVEEEVEVMSLVSWAAMEEVLKGCFAQEVEAARGRDLGVEVVHLKARGCLQREAARRTFLPQVDLRPALASSAAVEAGEAQRQHQIVLVLGSAVQEVGSQTCQHLRWEEVL